MLNHSGKVPEIPFLWISALNYELPQLVKHRPCSQGISSSPLALVLLQPNLWHVPEMLPENSEVQNTELQGSIHLSAKSGKSLHGPYKNKICFLEKDLCLAESQTWPCISRAIFALIQHIGLHHRGRPQSFTKTAILHGRLKAFHFYLNPPALTFSPPCKMHSAFNAEIHQDPFLQIGNAGSQLQA